MSQIGVQDYNTNVTKKQKKTSFMFYAQRVKNNRHKGFSMNRLTQEIKFGQAVFNYTQLPEVTKASIRIANNIKPE